MKKITLILFVLLYSIGFSQNAPVTFEAGEIGSSWSFTNFDNGTVSSVGYEKVANPNVSGINTSATVGKFTAVVAGAAQAGCQSNDIGKFTLTTNNSTVKIMVYKTEISDVALKFEVAGGGSLGEIKVANTKINEWEELTFDFYGQIGKLESTDIVKIRISLDYQARSADKVSYFDNLTFSKSTVVSPKIPCDAVFKDAQQGSFDLGYKAKFETSGTNVLVTFELLDQKDGVIAYLWRESPFAEYPMANQGGTVFQYTLTGQTSGAVITYACKFAFAGGSAVTKYFKYTVGDSCGTEVAVTTPTVAAPTPPARETADVISIYGGSYTNITGVNTNPGWGQETVVTEVDIAGNKALEYAKFNYQGTEWEANSQNISTMEYLHVDVWTNAETPNVFVISSGAEIKNPIPSVAGSWQSLDIPVAGITGDLTKVIQFKFDGGTAGKIYLDNLYFYKGSALSTTKFDVSNVKMYPNPVKNNLTIEANSTIERVSVYNILGQEVLTTRPSANAATLQTSNLQKGIYFVKTEIDGKVSASKIIKE
jgi:hypothetical protein